jgi:TolA-binding protein
LALNRVICGRCYAGGSNASKGVIQLVGECYGTEPLTEPLAPDEQFGRVSYTQYEALYAISKGKKVWYLFLDEGFATDSHEKEAEELESLQSAYRVRVKSESHLYHPLTSKEGLEASVLKLRDDLTRMRRGVKRWAALVAVLLIFLVALSIWLLQGQLYTNQQQQQTNQQLQAIQEKFDKLQQGVNSFVQVQNQVRQEQPGQKPEELEERTYEELGKQLGIDATTLKEQLPRFAEELKKARNASTLERANAAYVGKNYNEAERLALVAAAEAQRAGPGKNSEAIKAFELAGWAAEQRVEYAEAIERLRAAEKLTDRTRDPLEWARVQFAPAYILDDQGHYSVTEGILREVLKEREQALGLEHPDTLRTRLDVANSLYRQGKYAEAEVEYRAVLQLKEKVLGPEHPDTLSTCFDLALCLRAEDQIQEASRFAQRAANGARKVLGPDHPDTKKYEKLQQELPVKAE